MSSSVFYSLCFCDKSFYDCDPNKKASVKLHKRKQETNDPRLKAKGNRAELSFGFLCVFAWMQPRKRPSDFARSLSSTDSCLPVSYLASTWRDRRELPPWPDPNSNVSGAIPVTSLSSLEPVYTPGLLYPPQRWEEPCCCVLYTWFSPCLLPPKLVSLLTTWLLCPYAGWLCVERRRRSPCEAGRRLQRRWTFLAISSIVERSRATRPRRILSPSC